MDQSRRALLDDHADRALRMGDALPVTVLRTRSVAGRELLAYLATRRLIGYHDLVETVRAAASSDSEALLTLSNTVDRKWFAHLARVLAVQSVHTTDRGDAVRFYQVLERLVGRINLSDQEAKLFAESLVREGRLSEVKDRVWDLPLASHERALLSTDLMNPCVAGWHSISAWLQRLEETMGFKQPNRLIALSEEPGRLFDRLTSTEKVPATEGPLVSVILTTFRPDIGLVTAVRSILEQSWQSTELLVIDDGSPQREFLPLLNAVEDMDPRVRLIQLANNEGTYKARNVGLAAAAGEFVTFQDSDDWSHPLRIESQLMPMLQDQTVVVTTSTCIRADDDLVLTSPGYPLYHPNTSSLMFRTNDVVGRVGFMDGVRKAADTEYLRRIQLAFKDGYRHLDMPALAVVRLDSRSLSRSEFLPGWQHQARFFYKQAYEGWHSRIEGGASPYLDMDSKSRTFSAPSRYLVDPPDEQTFDVVFVGDWRAFGGPQKSMIEEIRSLREAGASVAVAHMESFRFMTSLRMPSLCEPVRSLERRGEVSFVTLDDAIDTDLVILRYPPILQFPPHTQARWTIQRLWIVANQAPSEIDGSDVRYLPKDCDLNAREIFGVQPEWVPQSDNLRSILEDDLPPHAFTPFNNPGIIRADEWFTHHVPDPRGPIRIGRYSRDNLIKFPTDPEDLLGAYPSGSRFSVRMMGAHNTITSVLKDYQPIPDNWSLYAADELPVQEFLKSIDFFVYFDNPMANEAFGRSLLEAIASGVVVIAEPRHESTFAAAALYCRPAEVKDLVTTMAHSPAAYRAQVRTAQEVVDERFSPEAFRNIVSMRQVPAVP